MKKIILSLLILCLCFTIAGASDRLNSPEYLVGYWLINSNASDYIRGNDGTWTAEAYTTRFDGKSCGDFDGATAKIALGDIYDGVKSVSLWVKPATTTEQFLELNASTDVDVAAGTIGTTGWTAPSTYVDGASGATMIAGVWQFVVVTSATAENASAVNLGVSGANFGDIELSEVRFYSTQLTADEVKSLFIKSSPGYKAPEQPIDAVPDVADSTLEGAWLNKAVVGTADDLSVNNNDMTATGNPGWEKIGADFNGTTDFLDAPANAVSTSETGTISLWVYFENLGALAWQFAESNQTAASTFIGFRNDASGKLQFLAYEAGGNIMSFNATIVINRWYHVCAISNGSNYAFYLDGSPAAFTVAGGSDNGDWFADMTGLDRTTIGCVRASFAPGGFFNGKIKDVRIYDEEKNAEWIANEYAKGVPDDDLTASLPDGINEVSRYDRTVTYASTPQIGDWTDLDGVDDYVALGDIGNVQQIQMWIEPNTTTEEVIYFKAGNDIIINAGTVEYTGVTEVATYVNGVATSTVAADYPQFLVCQFSTVDSDSTEIGYDGAGYGDIKFKDFRAYDAVKSADWIASEYQKTKKYY